MPRGNGTGPAGMGPMTGRGMGYCSGFNVPGFLNPGFGRGFARGFGRGRGFAWRARFMPEIIPLQPTQVTEEQEKQYLEEELRGLKEEMKEIEKRLKELKTGK